MFKERRKIVWKAFEENKKVNHEFIWDYSCRWWVENCIRASNSTGSQSFFCNLMTQNIFSNRLNIFHLELVWQSYEENFCFSFEKLHNSCLALAETNQMEIELLAFINIIQYFSFINAKIVLKIKLRKWNN